MKVSSPSPPMNPPGPPVPVNARSAGGVWKDEVVGVEVVDGGSVDRQHPAAVTGEVDDDARAVVGRGDVELIEAGDSGILEAEIDGVFAADKVVENGVDAGARSRMDLFRLPRLKVHDSGRAGVGCRHDDSPSRRSPVPERRWRDAKRIECDTRHNIRSLHVNILLDITVLCHTACAQPDSFVRRRGTPSPDGCGPPPGNRRSGRQPPGNSRRPIPQTVGRAAPYRTVCVLPIYSRHGPSDANGPATVPGPDAAPHGPIRLAGILPGRGRCGRASRRA